MTTVRTFDRQVRPVRVHLTLDRSTYLCGYVQRPAELGPNHRGVPMCGPCVVAMRVLAAEFYDTIESCAPPDIDLRTSVALLRETGGGLYAAYDLDRFAVREGADWERWRHSTR